MLLSGGNRVDEIRGFTFTGLPITGQVTVRCLGGCFKRRLVKNALNWPQAVRFVDRRTFHVGQRLVFTFSDPSHASSAENPSWASGPTG